MQLLEPANINPMNLRHGPVNQDLNFVNILCGYTYHLQLYTPTCKYFTEAGPRRDIENGEF